EIQSSHPDRIRALIVDGANPLASYADTQRFREAFDMLDLLVVIEPAMTETARVADYVLPTPVGYEKWEMSIFPKDKVSLQLRPPVVNGPEEALPEIEIYYRLAREMGVVGPAPKRLASLAKKARSPFGAPSYLAALGLQSALRGGRPGRIVARSAFWLYETLGPTLPNPMLSIIWIMSHGYAATRGDQVKRAFPEMRTVRNPARLGELVFSQLLAHPEGVIVGYLDDDRNFETYCSYRDGKARMFQADFVQDIKTRLSKMKPEQDTQYPLILNGGMRTGWSANTIVRDPSWRKGKGPHAALLISKEDAESLGVEKGAMVRLSTHRGSIILPSKIDTHSRPGHVHVPNIFDLRYPDAESGELQATGIPINELTDAQDRDPYTGIPNFKRVYCRVEPV
ncbi:MAG: molybdopterin-dependent oxidoreductase, partial [Pseudomonadales bacterium]|nr:molybdopterin-dependent oxidoreductase [Pseudomonadales bacterium]